MTRFSTLHPDGSETNIREVAQSDMMKCPFAIMVPDHYHADGRCKCFDREHAIMAEWGYKWDEGKHQWSAGDDEL